MEGAQSTGSRRGELLGRGVATTLLDVQHASTPPERKREDAWRRRIRLATTDTSSPMRRLFGPTGTGGPNAFAAYPTQSSSARPRTATAKMIHTNEAWLSPTTQLSLTWRVFATASAITTTRSASRTKPRRRGVCGGRAGAGARRAAPRVPLPAEVGIAATRLACRVLSRDGGESVERRPFRPVLSDDLTLIALHHSAHLTHAARHADSGPLGRLGDDRLGHEDVLRD
jgi:hypothetical protein